MSENPIRLEYLFEKYATGKVSPAELEEFWQLVSRLDETDTLPEAMKAWWNRYQGEYDLAKGVDGEKTLKRILNAAREKEPDYLKIHHGRLRFLYRRVAVAAILILMLGGSVYLYLKSTHKESFPVARVANPSYKNDVLPGVTGATLTLANGSVVTLDSAGNRVLAHQGNVQVITREGTLNYNGSGDDDPLAYNTLTTSRGQQFPVKLSDGTVVVLDAGSSITYPVTFKGSQRIVEINGQAWFEVAKNPARPFIVKKGDKQVQVLGTHFNINAYDDENDIKVTLVEGSVKVDNGEVTNVLRPGQQAVLSKSSGGIKIINDADIDQAIAWKNGQFEFRSSDIAQVLRDAARWYDIEVDYTGEKPHDTFTGGINRTATLTELLTILEMSNVHFRLEGRKLTVFSK